jgi:signal peptidase
MAMTERRRLHLVAPVAAVVVVLLLPLAILLGTAWLFGWRFQPIETNSMAPGSPAGSLAVVQPVDVGAVEPGMIVVFVDQQDASRLIAHRVVKQLAGDPPTFQTKGDANAAMDPFPVAAASIRGKVSWTVAGLGGVVTAIRGTPAVLLLVVLPLALLVVTEVLDRRRRTRIASVPSAVTNADPVNARENLVTEGGPGRVVVLPDGSILREIDQVHGIWMAESG